MKAFPPAFEKLDIIYDILCGLLGRRDLWVLAKLILVTIVVTAASI